MPLTYLLYVIVLATLRGVGVGRAPVEDPDEADGGYREVLRDRRLRRVVVLGLVLMTCGYGSLEVGLPVIVTVVNGLSVSWVAVAFAVNTATIVVVQLVTLKRHHRSVAQPAARGRGGALGGVVALLGFSGALPATVAIVLICLSTAVFALGEMLSAPIMPSLVNDLAPEHLRGRYNAVQSSSGACRARSARPSPGSCSAPASWRLWIALVVGGCLVAGVLALRLRRHLTPALDGRAPDAAVVRVEQCAT